MATVLVTGANRGIGLGLARHYLAHGDDVLATARQPTAAHELAALSAAAARLSIVEADVTSEASLAQAARTLDGRALDLLICNAGVMSARGGLTDPEAGAADWARVLAANVTGVFLCVRAFLANLKRARTPRIAIISSQMGSSANPGGATYAYRASKAAATNIGVNLSVELRPAGIAVGIYHPGWVATDLGGHNAPVSIDASARGLAGRIAKLGLATTGVFEDYQGRPLKF